MTEYDRYFCVQIRYVSKYEKMFEPHKWDVIVRVLKAPPSTHPSKSVSSRSTKSNRTSKSGTEYDLRCVSTKYVRKYVIKRN